MGQRHTGGENYVVIKPTLTTSTVNLVMRPPSLDKNELIRQKKRWMGRTFLSRSGTCETSTLA